MIKLECGDIIKMKKKHPCGSDEWEVIKVGADIKLKCCGCMHEIILKRSLVEKNTKKRLKFKIRIIGLGLIGGSKEKNDKRYYIKKK